MDSQCPLRLQEVILSILGQKGGVKRLRISSAQDMVAEPETKNSDGLSWLVWKLRKEPPSISFSIQLQQKLKHLPCSDFL